MSKTKPKWDRALYQMLDTWRTVYPNELHDPALRAFLRNQRLWDAQREHRLFIRYKPDAPHFYSMSTRNYDLVERRETSLLHNQRVETLLALFRQQDLVFGYRTFDDKEQQFVELFESARYSWEQEVTRTRAGLCWRHDIFGAHSEHRLTEQAPWVAVEVIDSHFPSEVALEAWLKLSLEFPCFVLFDFARRKNYFLKVDKESKQVRVIYFIHNGSLWKSGNRWENCTAAFFKEKVNEEISNKLK